MPADGVLGPLRRSIAARGLAGTVRFAVGRVLGRGRGRTTTHPFDSAHGVETSGLIEGRALAGTHASDPFNTAYFGVPPSRFTAAIERWRLTPGAPAPGECAFIDAGCGKGRALLLASSMGFREVIGVELNADLAGIARRNAELWEGAGRAQSTIEVRHGDAAALDLPSGPCLLYLYNPFRAPVLRQLLARLVTAPRTEVLDLLYLYPEEASVFDDFPQIERLWTEALALAPGDRGVDGISADRDPCSLYRIAADARQ